VDELHVCVSVRTLTGTAAITDSLGPMILK
jgi:hypothetical protein